MRAAIRSAVMVVTIVASSAVAQQQAILKASNEYTGRASWSAGKNGENFRAHGVVTAEFIVHPGKNSRHEFEKNPGDFGNGVYLPIVSWQDQVTDKHGTVANVSHNVSGALRSNILNSWFSVRDDCSATIAPGPAPNLPVSVRVRGRDPWTFGTLEDGALFEANPDGFFNALTLWSGTGFASPDGFMNFDDSVLTFRTRVSSGVVADPDGFWADDAPGAIDLYTLELTVDPLMQVHAELSFGASSGEFLLDYYDGAGVAFDPLDAVAVGALEHQIESSFVDGMLVGDLTDVLTVGFVPLNASMAYTAGQEAAARAAGLEVPVPGSAVLIALGGVLAARRRRA